MLLAENVPVLPLYTALEPYVLQLFGAIITLFGAYVTTQVHKWMGMTVDQTAEQTIEATAMNAATSVLAKLEGPISHLAIPVSSPLVAEGVEYLITHAPAAINQLNFTPTMLREIVLSKLGMAQVMAHDSPRQTIAKGS